MAGRGGGGGGGGEAPMRRRGEGEVVVAAARGGGDEDEGLEEEGGLHGRRREGCEMETTRFGREGKRVGGGKVRLWIMSGGSGFFFGFFGCL